MSDEFYNDMAATAAELLVEFGADASIVRSASTYDPATGAAAQSSTTHAYTSDAAAEPPCPDLVGARDTTKQTPNNNSIT